MQESWENLLLQRPISGGQGVLLKPFICGCLVSPRAVVPLPQAPKLHRPVEELDFQRQGQTLILAPVTVRVYGLVLKGARCFQGNALKIYRSK